MGLPSADTPFMVCGVVQLRPFELEYAIHRAAPLACRSAVRTRLSASVVIAGSHGPSSPDLATGTPFVTSMREAYCHATPSFEEK